MITIVYLRCSKEVLRIRMLNRGDSEEDILRRLEGDSKKFTDDIIKLADLIIDTTPSNIYRDAKIIYDYYMRKLYENKKN